MSKRQRSPEDADCSAGRPSVGVTCLGNEMYSLIPSSSIASLADVCVRADRNERPVNLFWQLRVHRGIAVGSNQKTGYDRLVD